MVFPRNILEFSPEQTSAIYSKECWVIIPKCLQIRVVGSTNSTFAAGLCVIPTGQEVRATTAGFTFTFSFVDDVSFNGYPHTPLHFYGAKISLLGNRMKVFNQM